MSPGHREQKKARTQAAIQAAAMRMFERQGYERTTIAQIAHEAGIAPRTFFSYYAGKESLVFKEGEQRLEVMVSTIADRQPGDTPGAVLLAAMLAGVQKLLDADGLDQHSTALAEVLRSVPALRAQALGRLAEAQQRMTAAMVGAFAPELDEETATMVVGAVFGATVAVGAHGVTTGATPQVALRRCIAAIEYVIGSLMPPA
jgi:AcrR family transcriptional regulator